jgi:hypothetical protein
MLEDGNLDRQLDLYWKQLEQVKVASICIRLYRDRLARWTTGLDILKAVASSGTIGAWVIWRDYAFVWATIIALAQVVEALKSALPFARRSKAANALALALELLFIDAEFEWDQIVTGQARPQSVMERRRSLQRHKVETVTQHFPDGYTPTRGDTRLAISEMMQYMADTHGPRR